MPSLEGTEQTRQVTFVAEMSTAPILVGMLLPAVQPVREPAGARGSTGYGKVMTFTISTTQP